METNETWRDRFKEKYLERPYEEGIIYASGDELEDFIQSEIDKALAEQKREIVEEVKKTKLSEYSYRPGYSQLQTDAHNEAAEDIINNLK